MCCGVQGLAMLGSSGTRVLEPGRENPQVMEAGLNVSLHTGTVQHVARATVQVHSHVQRVTRSQYSMLHSHSHMKQATRSQSSTLHSRSPGTQLHAASHTVTVQHVTQPQSRYTVTCSKSHGHSPACDTATVQVHSHMQQVTRVQSSNSYNHSAVTQS